MPLQIAACKPRMVRSLLNLGKAVAKLMVSMAVSSLQAPQATSCAIETKHGLHAHKLRAEKNKSKRKLRKQRAKERKSTEDAANRRTQAKQFAQAATQRAATYAAHPCAKYGNDAMFCAADILTLVLDAVHAQSHAKRSTRGPHTLQQSVQPKSAPQAASQVCAAM